MGTEGWRCGRHNGLECGASTSSRVRMMELFVCRHKGLEVCGRGDVETKRYYGENNSCRSPEAVLSLPQCTAATGWQLFAGRCSLHAATASGSTARPGAVGRVCRRVQAWGRGPGLDGLAQQDTSRQRKLDLIDHYGCISASRAPALHRWATDCNAAALRRAVLQRQSSEAEHRGRAGWVPPSALRGRTGQS